MNQLLESGENRMSALLDQVKTTCVPLPQERWVRNINTPEELAQLRLEQDHA